MGMLALLAPRPVGCVLCLFLMDIKLVLSRMSFVKMTLDQEVELFPN